MTRTIVAFCMLTMSLPALAKNGPDPIRNPTGYRLWLIAHHNDQRAKVEQRLAKLQLPTGYQQQNDSKQPTAQTLHSSVNGGLTNHPVDSKGRRYQTGTGTSPSNPARYDWAGARF